jgi:ATPase family associated with various cellular activities (AAA)
MTFMKQFSAAHAVSTPCVSVRTSDAASTIANIRQALVLGLAKSKAEDKSAKTPLLSWDAIHGLRGVNDKGSSTLSAIIGQVGLEATVQLPITLQVLENAPEDTIIFMHNVHLFWADPLVLQGIWNLRDPFKTNGRMLILLTVLGTILPPELNNDVLALEEPLPSRPELRKIIQDCYGFAGAKEPAEEVYTKAADALVGIASFPADQAVAMSLDKDSGDLDIKALWKRKKDIVTACPGMSFYDGPETLQDAGGLSNIKTYISSIMRGKYGAKLILRTDEIEKMFAGAGTDSSGVKGSLLGNFLSWVEDKKVLCMLFLGVPGASKSHIIRCVGGEFGVPVINFNIADMEDSLVGNSGKNLRQAQATAEAISDGRILLCATANSLRGLPAELLSRFEKGGIFFFDTPNATDRQTILDLKIKAYSLTPDQVKEIPDMAGWTGREIDSMCMRADMMGVSLARAAQYVVPLTKSHAEDINALRASASHRFLSASSEGLYEYTAPETTVHTPTVSVGRKIR